VTATASSSSTIALTWAAVEGATSYKVYQGEEVLATVTETTYTVTGLEAEKEYCFNVTAINEVGESAKSENACATTLEKGNDPIVPEPEVPSAPKLTAEATSDTTIVLTWNSVMTATSYKVYQGEEVIATVTETTYTVTGLTENTEYCFAVTAINENGESNKSAEVCATTKPDAINELEVSFNIYPNPVNDKLYIETLTPALTVEIYDIYGRVQNLSNSATQQLSNSIDVTNLNSGVYFVKVVTANGEAVQRFIKK
jgi:predicted phage tail protein